MLSWCQGRCVVCIEALVLLVYSVQHGRKFLLAARLIHPTSDRHTMQPEFCPPYQLGHNVVGASLTLWYTARSHLLSNSQHSIQPRHSYS